MFLLFVNVALLLSVGSCLPQPAEYVLSYPTNDNPLNIKVVSPAEKNYFMLLGDWGAEALENKQVQQVVADKMNDYYNKQAANGYNLLAVLALGDNFYYTGQTCQEWVDHWESIYNKNLTSVPWLSVYGNHDWGDSDPWAMCAWNASTNRVYVNPNTGIPYAANQLNKDKGGCNPDQYYLPDFGYHYDISALNFELIALDESCHACTDIGGGYGSTIVYQNCGGFNVGCSYLGKIANASENMLIERAKTTTNNNILIMQHYPSQGKRLRELFETNRMNGHKNDTVWSIFGHAHEQKCDGSGSDGICNDILSGGGGGCCTEHSLRGFYVIGFDKNMNMIQPLKFNDPAISCLYPCNDEIELTTDYMIKTGFDTCCHTHDSDINCELFDLNQCSAYYPPENK